jgi:hypothetical protein
VELTGGCHIERIFSNFLQKRLRQVIYLRGMRFAQLRAEWDVGGITIGAAMLAAWGDTVRSV